MERAREAGERARRRRKLSARVGALGVIILFAAGLALGLSGYGFVPASGLITQLVAAMIVGIVLIAGAFLLVRPSASNLLTESGR